MSSCSADGAGAGRCSRAGEVRSRLGLRPRADLGGPGALRLPACEPVLPLACILALKPDASVERGSPAPRTLPSTTRPTTWPTANSPEGVLPAPRTLPSTTRPTANSPAGGTTRRTRGGVSLAAGSPSRAGGTTRPTRGGLPLRGLCRQRHDQRHDQRQTRLRERPHCRRRAARPARAWPDRVTRTREVRLPGALGVSRWRPWPTPSSFPRTGWGARALQALAGELIAERAATFEVLAGLGRVGADAALALLVEQA